MNVSNKNKSELIIRALTEDDAENLTRCVKACYGDTYPAKDFYDPEKILTLLRKGLLSSQVAVTREGEVVGHLGIMLEHIGDITADAVAGFVAPDYRGGDTMFRLGLNMNEMHQQLNLIGLQICASTLHPVTQKKALFIGGMETGILPAHTPASSRPAGFKHPGTRRAEVLIYVPLHQAPERNIFVPEPYADILDRLYKRLKYARSLQGSHKSAKRQAAVSINKKPNVGRVHIKVQKAGSGLPDTISRLRRECKLKGFDLIYIDLPLCDPASAVTVDDLRSLGAFYGGVIVERGGGDILRMQLLIDTHINTDAAVIESQNGRDLLAFVLADARDVGAI